MATIKLLWTSFIPGMVDGLPVATSVIYLPGEHNVTKYHTVQFSTSVRIPARLILSKFWQFTAMLRGAGTADDPTS